MRTQDAGGMQQQVGHDAGGGGVRERGGRVQQVLRPQRRECQRRVVCVQRLDRRHSPQGRDSPQHQ